MKSHFFKPVNSGYYVEYEELSPIELEEFARYGVKEIWYWYGTAPYEGSGFAVMFANDGRWAVQDIGHCSCYGPSDVYMKTPDHSDNLDWRDSLREAVQAGTDAEEYELIINNYGELQAIYNEGS